MEKVVDPTSSPPSGVSGALLGTPEAWPQRFIISYSLDERMPFQVYNNGLAELGGNNINITNNDKKTIERKTNSANVEIIKTRALGKFIQT